MFPDAWACIFHDRLVLPSGESVGHQPHCGNPPGCPAIPRTECATILMNFAWTLAAVILHVSPTIQQPRPKSPVTPVTCMPTQCGVSGRSLTLEISDSRGASPTIVLHGLAWLMQEVTQRAVRRGRWIPLLKEPIAAIQLCNVSPQQRNQTPDSLDLCPLSKAASS